MSIEKLPRLNLDNTSNAELKTMVHALVEMVNNLIDQVECLKMEVAELKAAKNSGNSSVPHLMITVE